MAYIIIIIVAILIAISAGLAISYVPEEGVPEFTSSEDAKAYVRDNPGKIAWVVQNGVLVSVHGE